MEYYFCPYCGTKNYAKAKFCNECGKDLPILSDFEKKESFPDHEEQIEISGQNDKIEKAENEIVQREVPSEMEQAETEASADHAAAALTAADNIANSTKKSFFSKGKIIALVAAVLIIIIGIIIVVASSPQKRQLNAEYQQAIKQYEEKEYTDAAVFFMSHQDYKQSKEYFDKCRKHFASNIDSTIDNIKMISEAIGDYEYDENGGTVYVSDELKSNLSSFKMVGLNGTLYFIPADDEDSDGRLSGLWESNYYLDDDAQKDFIQLFTLAMEEEPQVLHDDGDVLYVWENIETNLQIIIYPDESGDLYVVFGDLDHKLDTSDMESEEDLKETSKSSAKGKTSASSSTSSTVGGGTNASHTCEECSKPGIYSIQGISGQTEYYCAEHYEKLKELEDYLYGDD